MICVYLQVQGGQWGLQMYRHFWVYAMIRGGQDPGGGGGLRLCIMQTLTLAGVGAVCVTLSSLRPSEAAELQLL